MGNCRKFGKPNLFDFSALIILSHNPAAGKIVCRSGGWNG
jgi:hypothetical protein